MSDDPAHLGSQVPPGAQSTTNTTTNCLRHQANTIDNTLALLGIKTRTYI